MRCEDLMRRPVVSCRENDTVQVAARRMRDAGVGFLPVCAETGRVTGVITDRDIAVRAVADNLPPGTTRAGDVMTRQVISVRPEEQARHAENLMKQNRKSRIVVLDREDRPVGVISLSDIAQTDQKAAAQMLKEVATREVRL
jgi:CBS domain-containing protein